MSVAKSRKNAPGSNSVKLIVYVGILLCLLISIVLLYPALRSYYIACRVNEQLLQEFAAVEERNQQIRDQIAYLNTPEGIADRARERFGWVPEGEQAVNITGLDVSDSTTVLPAAVASSSDYTAVLPATVASGFDSTTETWWTSICDVLFCVEEEQASEPIPDPFISDEQ